MPSGPRATSPRIDGVARPAVDAVVIALSGRALAASALRGGHRVAVLDLFADVDTGHCAAASGRAPGTLRSGFRAGALLEAARRIAPAGVPLVYGSGFDRRTRLLARLNRERPLLGNSAAVVRTFKSPAGFFGLLDRLRIPAPETRLAPPPDPRGWLAKRVGGAGGAHIRAAELQVPPGAVYYQRRIPGRPVSALFLADGSSATMLGYSDQWSQPDGAGGDYRYGGAAFPAILAAGLESALGEAVRRLVREAGLVGVNSADFLVQEGEFALLEVNPRPGASLDAFDLAFDASLFDLHVGACRGELPERPPGARRGAASMIVYAGRGIVAPPLDFWPGWVADIPRPGSRVRRGGPVCTVTATAADAATAHGLVERRARDLLTELERIDRTAKAVPVVAEVARDPRDSRTAGA